MTMKRFCATALLLLWSLCALAVQKSGTIVYINGSKFYVHTVQPGETLYGLSKAYEVGEKVILQHNPAAAQGLRAGESIKIPFVSDVPSQVGSQAAQDFRHPYRDAGRDALRHLAQIRDPDPDRHRGQSEPRPGAPAPRGAHPDPQEGDRLEDEAGTREQWEAYRNSLNSVAEEGFAYHIVKPGETFYSLSRRFGITEDRLGTLGTGGSTRRLKAGAIIKVPGSAEQLAAAENGPQADSLQVQDSLPGIFAAAGRSRSNSAPCAAAHRSRWR